MTRPAVLVTALLCCTTLLHSRPVVATAAFPPGKVITFQVHPDGLIVAGRDTLNTDNLADYLKERLWKGYLGTGKMVDSIGIVMQGEVLMGVRGAVLDAIRLGQENALKELCLQQYKSYFENLSAARQQKIRKKFPVLFQQLHW